MSDKNSKMQTSIILNKTYYDSYFDKKVKDAVILHVKMILFGIVTLGFAYPWIICIKQRATCKHTVICGRRLKFIGDPKELIAHWILWWFLSVITLGIYTLAVKVRFEQWIAANTVFEDTVVVPKEEMVSESEEA